MTKSLDEVIETMQEVHEQVSACEYCSAAYCNYSFHDGECFVTEAINYLKQYRDEIRLLDEEHKVYMRAMDEYSKEHKQIETWDELQQMQKKPLWIENVVGNKTYSGWTIVRGVTDLYLMTDERLFYRKDFNGTWKVYRKEPLIQVKDRCGDRK